MGDEHRWLTLPVNQGAVDVNGVWGGVFAAFVMR